MVNTQIKASNTSAISFDEFTLFDQHHENRQVAEKAVKRIFRAVYGAEIRDFLPLLLGAKSGGKIKAMLGLRHAQMSALYLEQYLSEPIDSLVAGQQGFSLKRRALVELGNLVSLSPGTSLPLFVVLAHALDQAGIEWVTFTATPQVEKLLTKLALYPIVIGQAKQASVANGSSSWGSYYSNAPKVCLGNVSQAVQRLEADKRISAMAKWYQAPIAQLAQQIKQGCAL